MCLNRSRFLFVFDVIIAFLSIPTFVDLGKPFTMSGLKIRATDPSLTSTLASLTYTVPSSLSQILKHTQGLLRTLHSYTSISNKATPASPRLSSEQHPDLHPLETRAQLSRPCLVVRHVWATTAQCLLSPSHPRCTGHPTKHMLKRNMFIQSRRSSE